MNAQKSFADAIAALGMTHAAQDLAAARQHFQRAADADPTMCDAWLGLAIAGQPTPHILARAAATSATLHRETRRLGLPDSTLIPTVAAPAFVVIYPQTRLGLAVAHIMAVLGTGDYDTTEKLLNDINLEDHPTQTQIHQFIGASLHYVTQRWPDVLDWTSRTAPAPDPTIAAANRLLTGIAETRLGRADTAYATLIAINSPVEAIAAETSLYLGLCERVRGNEKAARTHFQAATIAGALRPDAAAALADPTYAALTTTAEAIAARTDRWDPASGPSLTELEREHQRAGDPDMLAKAEAHIQTYIGLTPVKKRLHQLKVARQWDAAMKAAGQEIGEIESLNMTFVGPPGTAKTSIARDVGKQYCGLGLLSRPDVVEASRKDLVGAHIGETTQRTEAFLERARGGVGFIDEAGELYKPHTANDFGIEALDTIMKFAEDHRHSTMIIMAGYKHAIAAMLDANPGLRGRFPIQLEFPSYTGDEMLQIIDRMATSSAKVILSDDSRTYWHRLCTHLATTYEPASDDPSTQPRRLIDRATNGRFARMVITEAAVLMKNRVIDSGALDLTTPAGITAARTITLDDLRAATRTILPAQRLDPSLADL
ncbi:AAA family ATPase [Mycobacterium attenuatum]|uniref:AAA family ATPase n=1 Tax=Mycobacterium attenuatum TaxID=2341086 RepID=UPI000F013A0E|nr:AAA family ATPase [Mycobacterium attenuatum]VBA62391.1 ESX-3 secretion system protein EccA3 [Mycobacterium attenuatum]